MVNIVVLFGADRAYAKSELQKSLDFEINLAQVNSKHTLDDEIFYYNHFGWKHYIKIFF